MNARVAAATLAATTALAGALWWRALTADPATGPQVMAWQRADGSPLLASPDDLDPFDGCFAPDSQLDLAVWRGGLIVPCDDRAIGRGWAFLDPSARVARLRWPLAPDLGHDATFGLIPNGEQLAVAFGELDGRLFAGVMDPDGWAIRPEFLGTVRYLGAAWIDGALEVVVSPREHLAPQIIRFARGQLEWRSGPECAGCTIVYRAADAWIFEGPGGALSETGASVPRVGGVADLDLLAHGRLAVPAKLALGERVPVLDARGAVRMSPVPAIRGNAQPLRFDRFAIAATEIRRLPQYAAQRDDTILEQVGERFVAWSTDERDTMRIGRHAIARWYPGVAKRAVIPHHDGYWIVDASGEHVHLSTSFERTDPLPLREHLRQRGSLGRHIDEACNAQRLGVALFVIPVHLVLLALVAAIGRKRKLVRPVHVVLTSAVAALVALWCFAGVASLI